MISYDVFSLYGEDRGGACRDGAGGMRARAALRPRVKVGTLETGLMTGNAEFVLRDQSLKVRASSFDRASARDQGDPPLCAIISTLSPF